MKFAILILVLIESYIVRSEGNSKSSLVFVFDTTGSMHNDLTQLRAGAEMILKTALEESNVISDFVFVPFHDPGVGPATVTQDKEVFKDALSRVTVFGGVDCPEMSIAGIQLALNVSRPQSYIYVFTDATAKDHRDVVKVLDSVQRKQSQVVFVLTGHCNDLDQPSYTAYQQIAAASAGQVFNLNKTNVYKVLDFVRASIKGRTVNLGSAVSPPGYNYTQGVPVDTSLSEVSVSVSGANPRITVVSPAGKVTGPPRLVTMLDLAEIMVVKVFQPEPGNWTITTGSDESYSVKVIGTSNITFSHGFSVESSHSMAETSYRPLKGAYNHLLISLTETEPRVDLNYAEILSLKGKPMFEVALKKVNGTDMFEADPFVPPDEFFYISINGHDEYRQEFRRVGVTAIQAKIPDVPYISIPERIVARVNERVVMTCKVESLVRVTSFWSKDHQPLQPPMVSLQSTTVDYVIDRVTDDQQGTYMCEAENSAGGSRATTLLHVIVDPPIVTITPLNITISVGEALNVTCTANSDGVISNLDLFFNGTKVNHAPTAIQESHSNKYQVAKSWMKTASDGDTGVFKCVAGNSGGDTQVQTTLTVNTMPTAQIIGPHTIITPLDTSIQLLCHVENADYFQWISPSGNIEVQYNRTTSDGVITIDKVKEDETWTCVARRGQYNASDAVEITTILKPEVFINAKNITVLKGAHLEVNCYIKAKPEPRILWHKETEKFLYNNITKIDSGSYLSVLTLNTSQESINTTYFCFGENSEGISQDSVVVNIIRNMSVVDGFKDQSAKLYSDVELRCNIDAYPSATTKWYYNGSQLSSTSNINDTGKSLVIEKIDLYNAGTYKCIATNGFETMEVEGVISVYGIELPVLSKEPKTVAARKGGSVILTCRVTKGLPEPQLKWQYYNKTIGNYTALSNDKIVVNGSTVNIRNADTSESGVYKCEAENVAGIDVYEVSLEIQYPPEFHNSTEVYKDSDLEVKVGNSVIFTCDAIGLPPPIVTWKKDWRPISYSSNIYLSHNNLIIEHAQDHDSGTFTCDVINPLGVQRRNQTLIVYELPTIQSPTSTSIEVLEGDLVELPCSAQGAPAPTIRWAENGRIVTSGRKYIDEFGLRFVANLTDFGDYTCVALNKYGNASVTYTVFVWVAPSIKPPLNVDIQTVNDGNATFKCDAVGFPIPTLSWEFNNEVLLKNTTHISYNEVGNLNVSNAEANLEGVYSCVAGNLAGVQRKDFHLKVNEPPTIIQENYTGSYIATEKDISLTIPCKATGKPKPYIAWIKDDIYLDKDSRYDMTIDNSLILKSPTEDMSGVYFCLAKNSVGFMNKSVNVEIYALPSRIQADELRATETVIEGSNVTLVCPALTSFSDSVKWYKDARLLSQTNLTIANVSRHNMTMFACVVTNPITTVHAIVNLNVEWSPRFETIENTSVAIVKGDDHWFGCNVDAKPTAKIKWMFNSKLLLGEDKDRFTLLNAQPHNAGTYKCIATNEHGVISRQFKVEVLVPPFISDFVLLDVQLKEGLNATLECNARGSPAPNISWTYNNTNWLQSNLTLMSKAITTESEGLYKCTARNKAGMAHLVYRVTVAKPALIKEIVIFRGGKGETIQGNVNITLGTKIRLSCIVQGRPLPSISWVHNGIVLSENKRGISYSDLVMEAQSGHGGAYSCIASNEGGIVERKVELVVQEPPIIYQTLFQNYNSSNNETKLEVLADQPFYLHCHPYGNPVPSVYWFKGGIPLKFFDDSMESQDYGEVIFSKRALYDQKGNYTCVARNDVGETRVVYLVDVLVPPQSPKERTKKVNILYGQLLELTCPIDGSPVPNVVWVKHPYLELSDAIPRVQLKNDNVILTINNTQTSDSGTYSCVMTNKVGTTEMIFEVIIQKPPSIAGNVGSNGFEEHKVALGRSVVLKCQADGHPLPEIKWLKDSKQLTAPQFNIQLVLRNSLLVIWSTTPAAGGQYACVADNDIGVAVRRYKLLVMVPGKWSTWSQWGLCDARCGAGRQRRDRRCIYQDEFNVTYDKSTAPDRVIVDESTCKGPATERRKCYMPACEEDEYQAWTSWSSWSDCSVTCGAGAQARSRRCRRPAGCVGDNVQIRKCPNLPKCLSDIENDIEETADSNPYIPEATFELQPDVNLLSTDVEVFDDKKESKYTPVYHDVIAAEAPDPDGLCAPGYSFNDTTNECEDIDECVEASNQCHSTASCTNTAGGYRCACAAGYTALGRGQRCLDINECSLGLSGCEYACVNTAGGYVCACPGTLRLAGDRHRCVTPSALYQNAASHEDIDGDYLSTSLDYPARYKKRS